MAFRLTTFAGVTLPSYGWVMNFGTPKTVNPIIPVLNGALDYYGTRRRIEHSQYMLFDTVVAPDSAANTIQDLKELVGHVGYLVRVDTDGDKSVRRQCRLLSVGFEPRATQRGLINILNMRFWTNDPFWESALTTTVGPTSISSGSDIDITVAGEEDVLNPIITISASTNITSGITIEHQKTENSETITSKLYYGFTLSSGDDLVIDCGQYTVTDAGADAYDGFVLHSDHDELYWMRWPAGAQTIVITIGGGTGTYKFDYNAQYQ